MTSSIQIKHLHIHLPSVPAISVRAGTLSDAAPGNDSAMPERFTLSADGAMVTDHRTGLMWPVYESEQAMNYDALEKYVGAFRLGGFADWFNPSAEQRESIRDLSRYAPALFEPIKSRSNSWEWTCSPYMPAGNTDAGVPAALWQVDGYRGYLLNGHRDSKAFARPCRFVARAGQ